MPAQQKPKADSKRGQRNGDRRNGKAWKKNPKKPKPTRMLPVGVHSFEMPRSYMGYSHNRICRMAMQQYGEVSVNSVTRVMQDLKVKIDKKREYRRTTPAYLRRENRIATQIHHMRNRSGGGVQVVSVDRDNPDGPMRVSTIGGNKKS